MNRLSNQPPLGRSVFLYRWHLFGPYLNTAILYACLTTISTTILLFCRLYFYDPILFKDLLQFYKLAWLSRYILWLFGPQEPLYKETAAYWVQKTQNVLHFTHKQLLNAFIYGIITGIAIFALIFWTTHRKAIHAYKQKLIDESPILLKLKVIKTIYSQKK